MLVSHCIVCTRWPQGRAKKTGCKHGLEIVSWNTLIITTHILCNRAPFFALLCWFCTCRNTGWHNRSQTCVGLTLIRMFFLYIAHSAYLSSAKAESCRHWNSQNQSQPNPGTRPSVSSCTCYQCSPCLGTNAPFSLCTELVLSPSGDATTTLYPSATRNGRHPIGTLTSTVDKFINDGTTTGALLKWCLQKYLGFFNPLPVSWSNPGNLCSYISFHVALQDRKELWSRS